jgi:hypothetical protein
LFEAAFNLDGARIGRVFDCVADQVFKDLLNPRAVRQYLSIISPWQLDVKMVRLTGQQEVVDNSFQ